MFNIDDIVLSISKLFNDLNSEIADIVNIITQPQSAMPGLWNMIEGIFNCLLPIGYSLLALFFMLDLLNNTITFKVAKIENIIKIVIRVVLAKVIMQSSFVILEQIYYSVSDRRNYGDGPFLADNSDNIRVNGLSKVNLPNRGLK